MKEVIIKYRNNKTLATLKDLGKYLGFSVSDVSYSKTNNQTLINGVTLIEGDERVNLSELERIFTDKDLDAGELRKSGWQRRK